MTLSDALTPQPLSSYSAAERQLIARLKTPAQVQRYLWSLPYNREPSGGTLRGFRGVVTHKEAHCLEAVLFAAAVLEQHGYPPRVLDIESEDNLDHVVFLYEKNGKWGSVGRSRCYGLHGRRPIFPSPRALAHSYIDPFVDATGRVNGFGTANLDEIVSRHWRTSRTNNWAVERALIAMPHQPIHVGDVRHHRMRNRYLRFVEGVPNPSPAQWRAFYRGVMKGWM